MRQWKLSPSSVFRAAPVLAAAWLSACVVVPLDPKTGQPVGYTPQAPVVVVHGAAPTAPAANPQTQWSAVSTRLYPVNDSARSAGLLQAHVMDTGSGRGSFAVNYQGQLMQGEATRVERSYPGFGRILQMVQGGSLGQWQQATGQRGIANAANASHSMRCEYLFTSASQGTGACVVSDGSLFQIHFGG